MSKRTMSHDWERRYAFMGPTHGDGHYCKKCGVGPVDRRPYESMKVSLRDVAARSGLPADCRETCVRTVMDA